jgi:sulfane dehydrogenase subunit SoxC
MQGKAFWYNFEMGPKSVITYPSFGQKLAAKGFHEITGLAWSGGGAIRRVEVSVNGGKSWKDAELQGPILPKAHTRFIFPWTWNGEETVIQSRSTDERGIVQPSLAEFAKFWGVEPGFFETTNMRVNHFNAIYPWKVTRDGSIQNGLFS